MTDLLAALRGRTLPTTVASFPRDLAAYAAGVEELTVALQAARAASRGDDAAAQRVLDAQAALEQAPAVKFTLRALPPYQWDELLAAHPPTDEQAQRGLEWDPRSLRYDLLAVSVLGDDGQPALSADQWRALARAGELSPGELEHLQLVATSLNRRVLQVAPGKG